MSRSNGQKTKRLLGTVNPYDGCRHGCLYCYARTIRKRRYESWIDPKPRPKVLPQLERDIKKVRKNNLEFDDVFLCSACDGYQPLELEHGLTRQVIEILIENEVPFTLVTKSDNVLRDLDLIKSYKNCRVGCTIITLNDALKTKLEPYSPSTEARKDALKAFNREGVSTFCIMEPLMPTQESNPFDIITELHKHVDLFMIGKWSPYVKKGIPVEYNEAYYTELFKRLIPYCEKRGISYCVTPHSEEFLERQGIEFRRFQRLTNTLPNM